jgi:hypothetical protein
MSAAGGSDADTFQQNIVQKNAGVKAPFKDVFQTVKGYYPFFWMDLVCQQTKDPQFHLHNILIKEDHCLDYMVVGFCRNPQCNFQHVLGAKLDKASVPNFME